MIVLVILILLQSYYLVDIYLHNILAHTNLIHDFLDSRGFCAKILEKVFNPLTPGVH